MTTNRVVPVNLHARRSWRYWVRVGFSAVSMLFVCWLFTRALLVVAT